MMMMLFSRFSLFLAASLLGTASAADVTIVVKGVRSDQGQVAALAFTKEQGFPDQFAKAMRQATVPARKGDVTITLKDLPPGKYALTVMHDQNADGKLQRNIFGIPQEGVGVTGKPLGNRAPKFSESIIEVTQNENREITLKYW
jgi:uncharacterized protein (DUF2141 family)